VLASETFTSVSAPIQMASICAFEDSPDILDYIHASRKIMHSIGDIFSRLLAQQNIQVVAPDGGFYCLADFAPFQQQLAAKGIQNAKQLAEQLLQHTGVAGLPGKDFGLQQGLLMRLALVDFESTGLLKRVMDNPQLKLDENTAELKRLFSAPQRMGDWLNSL